MLRHDLIDIQWQSPGSIASSKKPHGHAWYQFDSWPKRGVCAHDATNTFM